MNLHVAPPPTPPETTIVVPLRHPDHGSVVAAIRTAVLADLPAVNRLHHRSALASRTARYFSPRRELREIEWRRQVNARRGRTWVTSTSAAPDDVLGVVQLLRTEHEGEYDLGLMVDDSWQGLGLGTALTVMAIEEGRNRPDCRSITALTGTGNARMLSILRGLGARFHDQQGNTITATITGWRSA
ncbi:GNAT family N-acetyltransferase [Streptomyces erythrochromogenes]|uniref:GNAT family N-acetyltransferase n=1 Tax=Streptomyces erythrochromogenes TaxID=285574 RepID=UPI00342D90C4